MPDSPNDPSQAPDQLPPEPLYCTKYLLCSLQQTKEDGWLWSETGLLKAVEMYSEEFSGPNMGPAIEQLLGVVGYVHTELERPDLAQRLLNEIEPRISDAHVNRANNAVAEALAQMTDDARDQFSKLLGPEPNLADAEPREKIDFQLPKGSVKG